MLIIIYCVTKMISMVCVVSHRTEIDTELFKNIKQFVSLSEILNVSYGVPQGSILNQDYLVI